ncbi:uncharacterized protein LOC135690230 [Rhopilema esculentum]|uniref:uncharacterized protein LOC135690230 n=1 Tax=Rhopilema esculentum TaxID=499914 RepID=UPI0031DCE0E8
MAYVTRGQGIGAIVLGILKLLIGLVIVIIGFVLKSKIDNAIVACFWAGFVFMFPGILGIIAGATKNACCMVTYMIINIIIFILFGTGAIAIFVIIAAYATVISEATTYCLGYGNSCNCNYDGTSYSFGVSCDMLSSITAAMWGVAISCLFAGLLSLASCILGCISSCCTSPPPTGIVYQEQPPAAGNIIISSQQQQSMNVGGFGAPPAYANQGYIPPKPGVV